ncbi:hypothetical protein EVAR_74380_1 [Eumeta japonica]|uniref:Uncharacterized protein n=1 Tax=Eumeta variegata TaxID=151549 RepID=A0A4C1SDB0_EUMVA|nr:hypothetical protein EVAR_74380_1 [Eumeta japonica]
MNSPVINIKEKLKRKRASETSKSRCSPSPMGTRNPRGVTSASLTSWEPCRPQYGPTTVNLARSYKFTLICKIKLVLCSINREYRLRSHTFSGKNNRRPAPFSGRARAAPTPLSTPADLRDSKNENRHSARLKIHYIELSILQFDVEEQAVSGRDRWCTCSLPHRVLGTAERALRRRNVRAEGRGRASGARGCDGNNAADLGRGRSNIYEALKVDRFVRTRVRAAAGVCGPARPRRGVAKSPTVGSGDDVTEFLKTSISHPAYVCVRTNSALSYGCSRANRRIRVPRADPSRNRRNDHTLFEGANVEIFPKAAELRVFSPYSKNGNIARSCRDKNDVSDLPAVMTIETDTIRFGDDVPDHCQVNRNEGACCILTSLGFLSMLLITSYSDDGLSHHYSGGVARYGETVIPAAERKQRAGGGQHLAPADAVALLCTCGVKLVYALSLLAVTIASYELN